jgi:acetyl esterase/lipase
MSLRYRVMRRVAAKVLARRGGFTVEELRRLQGPPATPPVDVRGVTFTPDALAGLDVEIAAPSTGTAHGDVLFLHGGGFVAGTPSTQRKLVGAIAREAGFRVWSVDYRLAPEHPFPAGLDDALAAYRALVERVDRLVLMGESAGGNLAASTLLAARAEGLALPTAVVLMAPFLDLTMSAPSLLENTGKDILTPPFVEMCRDQYVGDRDLADPRVSPLLADLSGLPPMLLQVGEYDLLRDDSVRFAQRASEAGSAVEVQIWPHAGHGFIGTGDDLPESRAAIKQITQWLSTF